MTNYSTLLEVLNRRTVWGKGHIVPGHHPDIVRKDDFGAFMQFSEYGNRNSPYGWEIDHIIPVALGGTDDISNLRPLWWWNNASLGGRL